ncbi:MAG: ThuA domain-containing protein [Puniceicoccales bacterium]|jgi:type 1 glutamine amidotransferase|nr:ThuA domain-containing protein [Puniceicoccales bacterium]
MKKLPSPVRPVRAVSAARAALGALAAFAALLATGGTANAAGDAAENNAAGSAAAAAAPRVLVFSKTNGFRHTDAIDAGKKFFAKMGELHGFAPVFSEDAAVFTDDALRRFDAIVLLCTAGEFTMDVPAAGKRATAAAWDAARKTSAERREAFRRRIAGGAALVGLHAATDNFKVGGAITKDGGVWDEYARIIGGAFQHHPAHQNAVIKITDKTHATTRHLEGAATGGDGAWRVFDEWYDFKDLQRDNHVLLDLDDASLRGAKPCLYAGGGRAGSHPLAWTRSYGKARVFYTARGHYGAAFGEPAYAQHVIAGLFWALNRPVPKIDPATLPPVKPLPQPKPARRR